MVLYTTSRTTFHFQKKGKSHKARRTEMCAGASFFSPKNAGSRYQQRFLCMKILSQMEVAPRCKLFSLFTLFKQLWSKKAIKHRPPPLMALFKKKVKHLNADETNHWQKKILAPKSHALDSNGVW